jgi:hypothetical protein
MRAACCWRLACFCNTLTCPWRAVIYPTIRFHRLQAAPSQDSPAFRTCEFDCCASLTGTRLISLQTRDQQPDLIRCQWTLRGPQQSVSTVSGDLILFAQKVDLSPWRTDICLSIRSHHLRTAPSKDSSAFQSCELNCCWQRSCLMSFFFRIA